MPPRQHIWSSPSTLDTPRRRPDQPYEHPALDNLTTRSPFVDLAASSSGVGTRARWAQRMRELRSSAQRCAPAQPPCSRLMWRLGAAPAGAGLQRATPVGVQHRCRRCLLGWLLASLARHRRQSARALAPCHPWQPRRHLSGEAGAVYHTSSTCTTHQPCSTAQHTTLSLTAPLLRRITRTCQHCPVAAAAA